ncbi:hypothetical protein WS58_17010 [Burkholderia pseudomultivorans]|nr:hypothetical protein WS57_21050 [Burkholderia pseudomultivorans]KVC37449.1 hypothetical protein WS55_29380 [Burkholderia pseudomultivorans]KVC41807.1 hypothetical protein WS58_17010 [Burkholderia pseudomultivorans]KVC42031.1 hypothetical protein WS56_01680 [Burkholderia pseudomultivorans]KVG62142.1 hypothetical protein WS80_26165 [Burkholderia pseudomultivorans]
MDSAPADGRLTRRMQASKEDVMMRSVLQRARRNILPHEQVVDRARAAVRSLRPIAFAYLADRVVGA